MTVPPESPDQPRTGRTKVLALVGILLLLAAGTPFLLQRAGVEGHPGGGTRNERPPLRLASRPPIPQARWDIDVDPVRIPGTKLSGSQRKRVAERRAGITSLIREVYDAMFLERARLRGQVRGRFTPPTAAAILRPQFGFPAAAKDVRTLRRSAKIAVEAGRGAEATAEITINATALIGTKPLRVAYRATLWLLREEGRWKVVALDADQEPVR